MSDEEKKAIKFIKSELQDEKVRVDYQRLTGLYGNLEIEILLNLIEKQSKEIEEYKECERLSKRQLEKQKNDIKTLEIEIEELKEDSCCMTNCVKRDKEKLFLEDKIKAKIEYNKTFNDDIHKYTTLTLEELLEKE